MTTAVALEHRYRPRGTARRLFACRDDEVLISGAAGTGKSRACLEKMHMMCLLNPGMRGLMVRKTHISLTSTALVTWREHVAKESIQAGDVWFYGGSSEEPPQYRYSNGSSIAVGGLDKPDKVMSSEYDLIYVQEATELQLEDWEKLSSRLRNGRVSFQQLMADCNPNAPTHWLKQRCDGGTTKLLHSTHQDNPVYYDDNGVLTIKGASYIQKLKNLTGVRKLRLLDGLWVAAEGVIFDEWNEAIHLVNRFDIPADWPRYWGVDFGYTNPFVCQMWAEDPDGRLWLYREFYETKKLVADHAIDILNAVTDHNGQWTEPKPSAIICDHDAEDRMTLQRALGLGTTNADKRVSPGIQATQLRFRVQGDGKPRIYILRDSLVKRDAELSEAQKPCCLVEEIPGYVWKKGPDNKPVKDEPEKRDDHSCDTMRYVVAHRDLNKGRLNGGWL